MIKPVSHSIVMSILAIVTLIFTSISNAEDKTNLNPPQDGTKLNAWQILHGIAALPAKKVRLQHEAEYPPATGGTETVVVWKGMMYTLWIWDFKADDGRVVPWARIYMHPASRKTEATLVIIGDAYLDGTVDDGSNGLRNPPSMFTGLDYNPKASLFKAFSPDITSPEEKTAAEAAWQKTYDEILANLAEFLQHATAPAKKTASQ